MLLPTQTLSLKYLFIYNKGISQQLQITDAMPINTQDHSPICYSFVSLKVCKEGKQKSICADSRNTE